MILVVVGGCVSVFRFLQFCSYTLWYYLISPFVWVLGIHLTSVQLPQIWRLKHRGGIEHGCWVSGYNQSVSIVNSVNFQGFGICVDVDGLGKRTWMVVI